MSPPISTRIDDIARPRGKGRMRAMAPAEAGTDRLFVNSVAKCFRALETFNAAQRPLSLKELTELSGLEKSAAQRLTHTLCILGYLRQHPRTRAYVLSSRLLEFSYSMLVTDLIREAAEPHLRALNLACRETVNLMDLEGNEIVYVLRYPSSHPVSVDLHVGSRLPVFCSAAGRAILAWLPEAEAEHLLAGPRKAMTEHTVTDLAALRAILAQAKREGYVVNNQEAFIGDISLAAPVFDRDGEVTAAINIAVPSPRWSIARAKKELAPLLLQCARRISNDLAGRR
ncbi:IclR family transcriptional regulator [Achromobacter aloeverae]|uniref:IclR family transcriptional regulator n=1 Tax=Achromobacter aloeverae TaxID=1750518 RepID=UPI001864AB89|nr:IclR family transcriptional regulator [Achromobacter aloeverae]